MVSIANLATCHNVKLLQTISMRRASWTSVSRFMSAKTTRAPPLGRHGQVSWSFGSYPHLTFSHPPSIIHP